MVGGKELTCRFTVDTGAAAPVFQKDFCSACAASRKQPDNQGFDCIWSPESSTLHA
jgi:hypothetical protein